MRWSLRQAAIEFGASRETIIRGLRTNGVRTDVQTDYSTREIFDALAGDLKLTRAKLARAELSKLERENAVAEGRLHSLENIQSIIWKDLLSPLRSELLNLPTTLGPRCTSAEESTQLIKTWVESTLAKFVPVKPPETPAAPQS
jgi:hypothetical protein